MKVKSQEGFISFVYIDKNPKMKLVTYDAIKNQVESASDDYEIEHFDVA